MFSAKLNDKQKKVFSTICKKLQIPEKWLYVLINHESSWKPQAANPRSSAKGLIQFIDSTAKSLNYENSQDLIEQNPTIEKQLSGPVYRYLAKYKPFNSVQSLFMAVFYPAYRNANLYKQFPPNVLKANPTIKTPYDYIKRAYALANLQFIPPIMILLSVISLFFF